MHNWLEGVLQFHLRRLWGFELILIKSAESAREATHADLSHLGDEADEEAELMQELEALRLARTAFRNTPALPRRMPMSSLTARERSMSTGKALASLQYHPLQSVVVQRR